MLKNFSCPQSFLWPTVLLWKFLLFIFGKWRVIKEAETVLENDSRPRHALAEKFSLGGITGLRKYSLYPNPTSCNFLSAVYCCHSRWSPDLILQSFEISISGPCEGIPYEKIQGLIPQAFAHILIACPGSSTASQWDKLQVQKYLSAHICRFRSLCYCSRQETAVGKNKMGVFESTNEIGLKKKACIYFKLLGEILIVFMTHMELIGLS